ncbi:MAG: hypothetical protein HYW26_05370 [Candidatus Aenigmarchaeota archaeon]|nr:hypothetical protein [Candidatus Aenigmarchaeota archaeon]
MRLDVVGVDNPFVDILYTPEGRKKFHGGSNTSTIITLARFGLRTGIIGTCGEDEDGMNILKELKSEKVDASRLRTAGRTSVCHIEVMPKYKKIKVSSLQFSDWIIQRNCYKRRHGIHK